MPIPHISPLLQVYSDVEHSSYTCDKLAAQYLFIFVNRSANSSSVSVYIVGFGVGNDVIGALLMGAFDIGA